LIGSAARAWDRAESRSLAQEVCSRDVTQRAVGDGIFQIPSQPRVELGTPIER